MTAAERLAESEAITAAATKGPWRESWPGQCCENSYCVEGPHGRPGIHQTDTNLTRRDATFIAYARSAMPKRDAALRAVLALHERTEVDALTDPVCCAEECDHEDACPTTPVAVCRHCWDIADTADAYHAERGIDADLDYPCPTVAAITEALA